MRASRSPSLVPLFLAALVVGTACDDPAGPPPSGDIDVVVLGSGADFITGGLGVSVDNGPLIPIESGRLGLTIRELEEGTYTVALGGLSSNCQVTSTNPRQVTVVRDRVTVITFAVSCTARVGSIQVTTATTGEGLDPDGYTAVVIGGPSQAVGINGTTTIANVREGQRQVTLEAVTPNCAITGADTVAVTVLLGATANVAFSVECVGFGDLEVTVSTTGGVLDPNGYRIDVVAASVSFDGSLDIAPNGSVTFTHLRPAADYRVVLEDVAANCDVVGGDEHTVAVTANATAHVDFDVVCAATRRLAIVRNNDIYTIDSDGAGATRLTTDPARDAEPAWSSTGRIAFTAVRHAGDLELYVMNEDGSNPVRLTETAGIDDAPSWSPDGQKIVFRSFRHVNSEIHVINADGSGLTRLTNNVVEDRQPAWSSTGKIAFISDRDHPSGELYVMNEDGSNVVRLTNNDSTEANPAWSPDGSMIAFSREVECYYGCMEDIFVINADGSNVRRLATGWAFYQYHTTPAWLPNGLAIAFTRQYCDYYYCDAPAVWVVDVAGSRVREIINDGADPAWKP